MTGVRFVRLLLALPLLLCLLAAAPANAQDQTLVLDIFGPGQKRVHIMAGKPLSLVPNGTLPTIAARLDERIRNNLGYLPFLAQIPAADVIGGNKLAGPTGKTIDFKRFQLSRVDLLISQAWEEPSGDTNTVELRVYETFSGNLLIGKAYSDVVPSHVADIADRFCGDLMEALTGESGFFSAQLAFSRKDTPSNTSVYTVRSTGGRLKKLTSVKGKCLSPAYAPGGTRLAFTHVTKRGHKLGIWNSKTGKTELHDLPGSSVISPAFNAKGRLAVTLDRTGSPDIFYLTDDYSVGDKLIGSWAIDVSPSFDAQGKRMVFTSGRVGNPHIFLLDMESGETRRLTYEGTYNTSPSISPDGNLVAFSRQTPEGHRIFLADLRLGTERQITFGPGNDEEPAFAPDGYFLAFASDRSGEYKLYLTTRHGDTPLLVDTGRGEAKAPTWAHPEK